MAKKASSHRKKTPQAKGRFVPKGQQKTKKGATTRKKEISPLFQQPTEAFLQKYGLWIFWGGLSLVALIVFGSYLFGPYLYFFKDMGSDTLNDVFPSLAQKHDLFREEGFTSWSFRQGMGNTMGPWFSVNPFFWINLLLGREILPYVATWTSVGYLFVSGFFFFQYLRTLGMQRYTTIFGAILYVFSGYVMGVHSWYSYNVLIFSAPLMLWGTELLLKKNNPIVLPIAIYFLAGPRLVTFGIFLIIYSFFRYVDENGWDWKGLIIFWLKIGGLSALGVTMAAYFFGGTLVNMLGSSRISGGASQANQLSQTPIFALNSEIVNKTSILRAFANDMVGSVKDFKGFRNYLEAPFYYVGTVSLLLIPQSFVHARGWRKFLYGGVLALWVMVAIFPFFRFAYFLFVVDHFRSFCLHFSLIMMFLSLFALNSIIKKGKVNLIVLLLCLLGLLAVLNYAYFSGNQVDENLRMVANVFLVVNAAFLFLISLTKYRYLGMGLLLLSLLAELSYFNYKTTHQRDPVTKKEYHAGGMYNDNTLEALAQIREKDPGFYRVQKDFTSSPAMHYSLNDAMVQGFFSTPTYQSINKQSYLDFLVTAEVMKNDVTNAKWVSGLGKRFMLQHFAGVKYVLRKDNGSDITQQGFRRIGDAGDIRIFQNDYALPLGFTYDRYFSLETFKGLNRGQKDLSLLHGAVIFENDLNKVSGLQRFDPGSIQPNQFTFPRLQQLVDTRKQGAFQMEEFHHDHLIGKVNMEGEKLLFFSIPFDDGWSMYIDGEEAELLRVNVGFMGTLVPAGTHEIELVHNIPRLGLLTVISLLGLGVFVFLVFWWRRQTPKPREPGLTG